MNVQKPLQSVLDLLGIQLKITDKPTNKTTDKSRTKYSSTQNELLNYINSCGQVPQIILSKKLAINHEKI
jgi:hypothetical protein